MEQKSYADLEREKIEIEINMLKMKWWKKPTYLSVLIPIILTLLTIITGFITGYLDINKITKEHNVKLKKATEEYNFAVDSINSRYLVLLLSDSLKYDSLSRTHKTSIYNLKTEKFRLLTQTNKLNKSLEKISDSLFLKTKELDSLKRYVINYSGQINLLHQYTNVITEITYFVSDITCFDTTFYAPTVEQQISCLMNKLNHVIDTCIMIMPSDSLYRKKMRWCGEWTEKRITELLVKNKKGIMDDFGYPKEYEVIQQMRNCLLNHSRWAFERQSEIYQSISD